MPENENETPQTEAERRAAFRARLAELRKASRKLFARKPKPATAAMKSQIGGIAYSTSETTAMQAKKAKRKGKRAQ